MARIERLDWDTRHFGFGVGRLVIGKGDTPREVRTALRQSGLDCIICRVQTDDISGANTLEELGFEVKDIKVHMTMDLHAKLSRRKRGRFTIRDHRPKERREIRRISSNSFWSTHFHADRRFAAKKVREMYSLWIDSALSQGSNITVALDGPKVAGFLVSKALGEVFNIDLVATARSCRRKGAGEELVVDALRRAARRYRVAAVDVQLANIPAIRLYEKMGFRFVSSEYTFHWWRTQRH